MYMPTLTRFTARDPLFQGGALIVGGLPQSFTIPRPVTGKQILLHGYSYVDNNPINYVDPSGMKKCKLPPEALLKLMKEFLKTPGWQDKDGRISLATVVCVACQESDYRPCVDSAAKAIGIMQITPVAWKQCIQDWEKSGLPKDGVFTLEDKTCCKEEVNPVPECGPDCEKNAWNWQNNIRCGIYMLKYCRDKVERKLTLQEILSCYNSGIYTSTAEETKNYIEQIMECIPDMKKQLEQLDKEDKP